MTTFPTSLGTSSADEIRLLGHDLTADLMGQVGFGELAFWLVAMRRPTPSETRVFEAVLVALADHGFTPTAIAARLTYLSAPDSLQGALAVGRVHEQVLGRRLPLNGAGVCGAALADLGLPVELLRGFALLARAAGLLGQIAEERRRPIGMDVYMTVDRNAVYVDPTDDAD